MIYQITIPTNIFFWLKGLTASAVIIVAVIIGLISIIKASKLNAKLLIILGAAIFFMGFLYMGPFVDFLSVIFTGTNIPEWLYPRLSYTWIAPAVVLGMYIGGELLAPKRKWIIVGIFTAIVIVYLYLLWISGAYGLPDFNIFTNVYYNFDFTPIPPSVDYDIIDSSFKLLSPLFLLMVVIILSVLVFNGIGFLIKSGKSTGVIRKKFLLLGLGFVIFTVAGAGDSLVAPGIGLVAVRLGMITSIILMYYGLKT